MRAWAIRLLLALGLFVPTGPMAEAQAQEAGVRAPGGEAPGSAPESAPFCVLPSFLSRGLADPAPSC